MRFRDKIALVTGAGGGIGRAVALRLGEEGAVVGVNDVSPAVAEKTAAEIPGSRGLALPADVSDSAQVHAMFARLAEAHGGLDVLVNNAGIVETGAREVERHNVVAEARLGEVARGEGVRTPWEITRSLPDASWRRMLAVHLDGTFYCCRAAIDLMLPRGGGSIVNMSSIAGLSGIDALPHYSAAKAGILGFTRALAAELGSQQIRVNAVCPGFIDTAMTEPASPLVRYSVTSQTPLGRTGAPEEVASVVAFLASDDAGFCTGQWISPNGGLVML
ncbi:MAG: SDR family NAD(P)-dependent oxidoreductase [Myxococcota bacterium]|nr:SDR family NAD(P)-dependent oxidoreductase [Myxococcota bacterium]